MCPATPRGFAFDARSLVGLREVLGRNQAAMASEIGVATNTLSCWETGATTPDADTLAAVYSIASDHGVDPRFFRRVAAPSRTDMPPTRLAFVWDLETAGISPELVKEVWTTMAWYLRGRFPAAASETRLLALKPRDGGESKSTETLEALGFRMLRYGPPSSASGSGAELAALMRRVERPGLGTVLVLASDTANSEIIDDAEGAGAQVYVWSPSADGPLASHAAQGRLIRWHEPFVTKWYVERVVGLDGRSTSRARWAQVCRARAGGNPQLLPQSLGLSSRGGYWEMLEGLAEKGFVSLSTDPASSRHFTAVVRAAPRQEAGRD